MEINWKCRSFEALDNFELYECMRLRIDVFVVEQNCPYPETDGKDLQALHLMGYSDNRLVAYSRIIPPGISYAEASFGRFVTAAGVRRSGISILLMEKTLEMMKEAFGNVPVRISAQAHLEGFYGRWGFTRVGNNYLEDGIPHVEMILEKQEV